MASSRPDRASSTSRCVISPVLGGSRRGGGGTPGTRWPFGAERAGGPAYGGPHGKLTVTTIHPLVAIRNYPPLSSRSSDVTRPTSGSRVPCVVLQEPAGQRGRGEHADACRRGPPSTQREPLPDRAGHRAGRGSRRPLGPPATTTMNTPCSRPRRWSRRGDLEDRVAVGRADHVGRSRSTARKKATPIQSTSVKADPADRGCRSTGPRSPADAQAPAAARRSSAPRHATPVQNLTEQRRRSAPAAGAACSTPTRPRPRRA